MVIGPSREVREVVAQAEEGAADQDQAEDGRVDVQQCDGLWSSKGSGRANNSDGQRIPAPASQAEARGGEGGGAASVGHGLLSELGRGLPRMVAGAPTLVRAEFRRWQKYGW